MYGSYSAVYPGSEALIIVWSYILVREPFWKWVQVYSRRYLESVGTSSQRTPWEYIVLEFTNWAGVFQTIMRKAGLKLPHELVCSVVGPAVSEDF